MSPPPFSVLLSVYAGDVPTELDAALDSVLDQTLPPDEVLVVLDGTTTPELLAVVERYEQSHPEQVETVALDRGETLGEALRVGVTECSHDLIARMDADDRAVETRFERQVEYLERRPEVDAVGGHVAEFETDPDDPERVRRVPTTVDDVRTTARTRNPINHPTVMFRREAVVAAGNYRDTNTVEDYDLWARMLANGATLTNLDAVLVHAHGGDDLYDRRGGLDYVRKEAELQRELRRIGLITRPRMVANLLVRAPIRLVPTRVRGWIYSTLLRDSATRS
ncbi:glycosyltransferase [Halorussus lipolyticus]|uniref:glycosyltransferase n=1 Tax=Halorussus lipolyticus TaxID=3034024 RepID=UPI0023E83A30|nr:glycosyltransferase [Halorussus sp. DT80]